ncbi:MAG: fused MFS/spermidine synthase [Hyphomonadaceae bacterium]|nr:fused MFS/spermidine synthase [Hyphomonadaceae bacterium]
MEAIARRAAAPIFTLALFSSAALIFVLQPLFARMVTPLLGGSPQVWNASMAFFQIALLVGYLYAHLLARVKDLRIQAAIHAVVLVGAWFVLPIHVTGALGAPNSEQPVLWLLGVLTLSVGAPFAAASATAPLLQAWYARSGRADAHDPYYLYAASNLGSFAGLLAYPILIEPLLGAQAQSAAWSMAYIAVGAMILMSAASVIAAHAEPPKPLEHTGVAPTWRQRLYWIAAAAVPSAMSMGATLHISTDVASAPMLWVIPLALYLGTFVLAFMKNSERITPATLFVHPIAVALMLASYYLASNWVLTASLILTSFFFSALICHLALSHSRPSADRLTEFYLYVSLGGVLGGAFAGFLAPVIFNNVYEFPLAMAAACLFRPRMKSDVPRLEDAAFAAAIAVGVLAVVSLRLPMVEAIIVIAALGAAAGMVAAGWSDENKPLAYRYTLLAVAAVHAALVIYVAFARETVIARTVVEGAPVLTFGDPWGWLLGLSSFAMLIFAVHGTIQPRRDNKRLFDLMLGAMLPTVIVLLLLIVIGARFDNPEAVVPMSLLFCGLAIFLNRGRPIVLAAIVLTGFAIVFLDDARGARIVTQERTFFGVLRTRLYEIADPSTPPLRVLMHGTTLHGAQIPTPQYSREPLTYYHRGTALGEAISAGLELHTNARLALIGLGTGSTACLMRPNDELTIYEIDPAVVRLSASPQAEFTFVRECQPNAAVVVGDARLRIADAPDGAYDVIVVDAFSSDAIPAHLLTREAIALYLSKLSENGVVVLHLSNRHLALVSEAARVARDLNAPTLYRVSRQFDTEPRVPYGASAASVMIVARNPMTLSMLPTTSGEWIDYRAPPGPGWTDDYINMPRALWDGLTGAEECRIYTYLPECAGEGGAVSGAAPAEETTPADPTSQ